MNAEKRQQAMQKYFRYTDQLREICQKPAKVVFEDKEYTSFTNAWSLAMTLEHPQDMELFTGKYPDVTRLLRFDGLKKKLDYRKIIADARSRGYRMSKKEVGPNFTYLMHYDGTYYKIGLLDITYRIIDDGSVPITYHPDGEKMPLTIQNKLGICMIMPVYLHGVISSSYVVIEVE